MTMHDSIPNFPKVRFENYLDQLVDGGTSNSLVRVKGVEKFLDNSVGEIGQKAVEEELNISTSCLRGWIKGRRSVPLSSLRKILKMHLEPDTYRSVWDEIFAKIRFYTLEGSPHKVTLPLYITLKLLYFVGYLYGDGCISDAKRRSYKTGARPLKSKLQTSLANRSKAFLDYFTTFSMSERKSEMKEFVKGGRPITSFRNAK